MIHYLLLLVSGVSGFLFRAVIWTSQNITVPSPETRAFSSLKVPTGALTIENLLRHYAKCVKIDVKSGR